MKGESVVKGGKCTMEKMSLRPRTVTIPPSKTCITGTTSKPLRVSLIEDDTQTWVLHKRTVDEKVIGGVTEGATTIGTVAGQVGKSSTVGAVVPDTAVLWMTGSSLMTAGAFILGAVNTEMARGMTLKTTSHCIRDGFWAQVGIARCNSCWIRSRVSLMKGRSSVSRDVRRDIEQRSGGGLWRWNGIFEARGRRRRMQHRDR